MNKTEQFEKMNSKEMKVIIPIEDTKSETISYDRILNDIQECEEKLERLNLLKEEADKLGLSR